MFSIVISFIFVIFVEFIVILLGVIENLRSMLVEFLRYYFLFCILSLLGIVLNGFVRNDGRLRLVMVLIIVGIFLNVLLDYIFIFILYMGVKGVVIVIGLG